MSFVKTDKIWIPKTSPETYISSLAALNIRNPEGTGDWHSAVIWAANPPIVQKYLYGEGCSQNTNHLLGAAGVFDATNNLYQMGYSSENSPIWAADHPRACVDYLYYAVLRTGTTGRVILEDWFPSNEDKMPVYFLLNQISSKLNEIERQNLDLWKKRNLF